MTINNPGGYLDGVWDWAILDGCFGDSRIRPMDIDGYIERRGCKLFIETKAPGVELPKAQFDALRSLVNDGHSLLILWGQQNRPTKLRLIAGACDRTEENISLGRVRTIVSEWYQWADSQPPHTPATPTEATHRTVEPIEIQEIDSMSSYQQITLLGNLGNDPEMRYTAGGAPVTSFSLAVSRQWTDAGGNRKEKVTWFRVSAWNNQAQPCADCLHKGSRVLVVGEVEDARVYNDRDGNPRASLEVKAQTVQFLDSPKEGATAQPAHRPGRRAPTTAAVEVQDEDIPF